MRFALRPQGDPLAASAPRLRRAPRPLWSPYLAGVLLGTVLLLSYLVAGRGLGATAAFSAVAAGLTGLVSTDAVQASAVHTRFWNDGSPLANWTLVLIVGTAVGAFVSGWQGGRLGRRIERGPQIGDGGRLALAFLGGFVVAFGARIAKGCTSGQALSGGALLNAGSLVFMAAVFAGAYALAWFVRREWL